MDKSDNHSLLCFDNMDFTVIRVMFFPCARTGPGQWTLHISLLYRPFKCRVIYDTAWRRLGPGN